MANTRTSNSVNENARPPYWLVSGVSTAERNRAWVLAGGSLVIALVAIGFAILVRIQPPTVIRIGPNGDSTVLGQPAKGAPVNASVPGSDTFLNQAFVTKFLEGYLNYTPATVEERWRASLNMMVRRSRDAVMKKMTADNSLGKVDEEQIQSVFHLREINPVPGEPLSFLAYGVKDVSHFKDGAETTDHFVNEYRIHLVTDHRSKANSDGLWIADYNERPIDSERRDQILAAPDVDAAHE
jgi:hypothetical protein